MSERAGSWGSGQVSGPRTEWRTTMARKTAGGKAMTEDIQAEREAILAMVKHTDANAWYDLTGRPELHKAADRLLANGLADVQWDGNLGGTEGSWVYRLTRAGRHTAEYLAPEDDRAFRAHPASNYNGGPIEPDSPDFYGNVLLDSPPEGRVHPVDYLDERPA
jgi:hypothetical protein